MPTSLKKLYQGSPVVPALPMFQYPTAATTGGSIAGGVARYYQVTAVVNGVETLPSAELAFTVPAGTSTNTLTLFCLAVPGATAYNWYAATTSGAEVRIGTSTNPTFIDTGAAGTGQAVPATSSLTEATSTPGVYVCPAGKQALVLQMIVSNPGSVGGTVSLSHVAVAGTGGASNRVLAGAPSPTDSSGGGPINASMFLALQAGEFLTAAVSVAGIVLTLYGVEF